MTNSDRDKFGKIGGWVMSSVPYERCKFCRDQIPAYGGGRIKHLEMHAREGHALRVESTSRIKTKRGTRERKIVTYLPVTEVIRAE